MIDTVEASVAELLNDGKIPVTLGGEHSITLGIVKALLGKYGDIAVVQFDAHTDMRDSYDGSPFSHACVMRRIAELGVQIVQIGIRSSSEEELTPLREYEVLTFATHEPLSPDIVLEKMRPIIKGPVYLTFDLDGLDPSIMPATGSPEPGGLDWETSLACLRAIAEHYHVVGFDMVELSPIPGYIAADFLAAKLTYKLIGYTAASPYYRKD
jgi:agmatinase